MKGAPWREKERERTRTLAGAPKVVAGRRHSVKGPVTVAAHRSEASAPKVMDRCGRPAVPRKDNARMQEEYRRSGCGRLQMAGNKGGGSVARKLQAPNSKPQEGAGTRAGCGNALPRPDWRGLREMQDAEYVLAVAGLREWTPAKAARAREGRGHRRVLSVFSFEGWDEEEMVRARRWFASWPGVPGDFEGARGWFVRWGFAPEVARALAAGRAVREGIEQEQEEAEGAEPAGEGGIPSDSASSANSCSNSADREEAA